VSEAQSDRTGPRSEGGVTGDAPRPEDRPGAASGGQATGLAFWGLVAAAVALDQVSKLAVFGTVGPNRLVRVIPGFFNLRTSYNPGAAFGLGKSLGEAAPVLLGAVNLVIAGLVVFYRYRTAVSAGRRVFDLALGLILAGAAGNLIDRFHPPHWVMDFLDFGIGRLRWHTFNMADAYIATGVALYIWWAWRLEKPRER
jgi:signal peptidase II